MDKVRQFLEECRNNPKAAELLDREKPKSEAEMMKLLSGLAKDMGYDVTEADLSAYYENAMKERTEKTAAAAEKILAESDAEMEAVAGGEEEDPENRNCGSLYQCDWQHMMCYSYIF